MTKIPASTQKLIINGKALTSLDDNKIIADCRIQDGTKVMVLGKKYDIEADAMYQKIMKVEENIIAIQKKLSEVCYSKRLFDSNAYAIFEHYRYQIVNIINWLFINFSGYKRSQGY